MSNCRVEIETQIEQSRIDSLFLDEVEELKPEHSVSFTHAKSEFVTTKKEQVVGGIMAHAEIDPEHYN